MNILDDLYDYDFYSRNFQKINTKLDGLRPLVLRDYQRRFIKFWESIEGPQRIIVLKPRQAGFSTIVAGKLAHKMCTEQNCRGLVMADKKGRTDEIAGMYRTFIQELEDGIRPMISVNNTERIVLDNPQEKYRNIHKGLGSLVKFETALDPNAGRSGTRQFAHMSEVAFYRYMKEIDDGAQNSIPLTSGTTIIKESTANGRAGVGKSFYDLWQAAKRGESIYKPFFVGWHEIDDYQIKPQDDFKATKLERDILKQYPSVTEANLCWRRLKLLEYLNDDESTIATPEERFCQDFPLDDTSAFLNTGAPVFDTEVIKKLINQLNASHIPNLKDRLDITSMLLKQFWDGLKLFTPPRQGMNYFIGADVSEGLAIGDASTACIIDENYKQVGSWFGKIDSDLFGHFLIALGEIYNNATIIPERNNMGIATVLAIRNEGYPNLYREMVEDKVNKTKRERFGWHTSSQSKMTMLTAVIGLLRDNEIKLLDIRLAEEMSLVSREENGKVVLNGRDRTVALCLAVMGRKQAFIYAKNTVPKINKEIYDTRVSEALKPKKPSGDIFA